jgi:hypothetical protein
LLLPLPLLLLPGHAFPGLLYLLLLQRQHCLQDSCQMLGLSHG